MSIIDQYIIKKYLSTFGFILLLLIAIAIVIDITEKIDEFLSSGLTTWEIITKYYIHFIPWISMMLAPIFVFIAIIFFTSRLTENSEIIAMLAGRVSFYRLLLPYLFASSALAGFFYMTNHYWLPNSNKKLFAFTDEYTSSTVQTSKDNVHFQFRKDTLVYTQSWNNEMMSGYQFTLEVFEGRKLKYKLAANRVIWDTTHHNWRVEKYVERTILDDFEDQIVDLDSNNFNWGFRPSDFLVQLNVKESMTTPELDRFIIEQKEKGAENLQFYETEKYRRTAVPVSTIILTFIAYAMTTQKRRNGMGIYIVAGLAISGIYVITQQFSTVFSTKGNLEPLWGAWIPNFIFTIVAAILVWRAPK